MNSNQVEGSNEVQSMETKMGGNTQIPDAGSLNLDPKTSLNLQDLIKDTISKTIAEKATQEGQAK